MSINANRSRHYAQQAYTKSEAAPSEVSSTDLLSGETVGIVRVPWKAPHFGQLMDLMCAQYGGDLRMEQIEKGIMRFYLDNAEVRNRARKENDGQ